jgi:hypothetical protein
MTRKKMERRAGPDAPVPPLAAGVDRINRIREI